MNKLPISASNLYAKNVFNFVSNLYDKENKKLNINLEDEIIENINKIRYEIDPLYLDLAYLSCRYLWVTMLFGVLRPLYTPLMSVTNAISSVIIVGAIIAALSGSDGVIFSSSSIFGFLAILLAAVNIFGGFLVTQRMLAMYKKKKKG